MPHTDARALAPIASILVDQVRLYGRAAELAEDYTSSSTIASLRNDRQALLSEVERKLDAMGIDEDAHGTLLGASHKAFLDARSAIGDDTKAAIDEVERGEEYLRDEIEKRLEDVGIGAETRTFSPVSCRA
ncbi:MAG: DUF2383 domain-containing protein [Phycisphaerales bacterium]|nr:DUF2383 domain-containing protein [Hyphomonadaceae bacterium]